MVSEYIWLNIDSVLWHAKLWSLDRNSEKVYNLLCNIFTVFGVQFLLKTYILCYFTQQSVLSV